MRLRPLVIPLVFIVSAHALAAQEPDGKAVYDSNCKRCHGARGTPPQTMLKKMPKIRAFDTTFAREIQEDSIVKVLTKGKGEDMKSFTEKLNPAEMAAVAKYVRTLALGARGRQ